MHTTPEGYFYGEPGGEIRGPLPIETIRTATAAGKLSTAAVIGHTSEGPWVPLAVFNKIGTAAFGPNAGKLMADLRAKEVAMQNRPEKSVGGFIEVIGYIFVGLGVLCIIGIFVAWGKSSPNVFTYAVGALSNLFSGLMFLAIAEVLKRLLEISTSNRKIAARIGGH